VDRFEEPKQFNEQKVAEADLVSSEGLRNRIYLSERIVRKL